MNRRTLRILVLSKRQYTGRDLLDDRYGRLFEIPKSLAKLGHQVRGLTLSYRSRGSAPPPSESSGGVIWESMNALPFSPIGALRHIKRIREICADFCPDIVWASSDPWHAIATQLTCQPLGIPFVLDLYDNYESFGLSQAPGVIPMFRAACRSANGLTVIGETLAEHLQTHYQLPSGLPLLILGNAVDTELFSPIDQRTARRTLGLPEDGLLIGTAGALDATRGITTLLEAYAQLSHTFPSLRLVLAGPRDKHINRFKNIPFCDLGVLPTNKVPLFWNAMDVAIIQNRDSAFGKYCYPQKLNEIIACGIPIVASDVGEVRRLIRNYPECLAEPDSPSALADRIASQLEKRIVIDHDNLWNWKQRAEALSEFFERIVCCS